MGAVLETRPDTPVGNLASRFDIYYLEGPNLGRMEIRVDQERATFLDTNAPEYADARYSVHVPDG